MTKLVAGGIVWSKTVAGLFIAPYETSRRIACKGKAFELLFIGLMLVGYFGLASLVKIAAFRPFLLSQQFFILFSGALCNIFVSVATLWIAGRLIGVQARILPICVSWAYTLVPTTAWFLMTSVLYVLFPPPRTTSVAGLAFSAVFIIVSATLLWWKIMLSHLAIRFVFRIPLATILVVYALFVPVLAFESIVMYRLGVFKVPFL